MGLRQMNDQQRHAQGHGKGNEKHQHISIVEVGCVLPFVLRVVLPVVLPFVKTPGMPWLVYLACVPGLDQARMGLQ